MNAALEDEEARYIVFRVGNEPFASPLLGIKEIVDPLPYCSVPNDHDYFLGLANLRGQIIGVIDLGLRLGKDSSKAKGPGVLLICEEEGTTLGALVSCVETAINLSAGEISEERALGENFTEASYLGIARWQERVLPIVSLSKLLQEAPAEEGDLAR